jgi:hypothetical protein
MEPLENNSIITNIIVSFIGGTLSGRKEEKNTTMVVVWLF